MATIVKENFGEIIPNLVSFRLFCSCTRAAGEFWIWQRAFLVLWRRFHMAYPNGCNLVAYYALCKRSIKIF